MKRRNLIPLLETAAIAMRAVTFSNLSGEEKGEAVDNLLGAVSQIVKARKKIKTSKAQLLLDNAIESIELPESLYQVSLSAYNLAKDGTLPQSVGGIDTRTGEKVEAVIDQEAFARS